MAEIQIQSDIGIKPSETITVYLHIVVFRTRTYFSIVNKFVIPVLLGSKFLDRFFKLIHPTKRKTVEHHSSRVPNLMVDDLRIKSEKDESDIPQH